MSIKIVSDSASDLLQIESVDFAVAPLTIVTDEKQYIDDANLDVEQMASELKVYKGRSSTACPGIGAWLEAFGDAKEIIVFTLTSALSGSYNAACLAKNDYEGEYPDRKVFVVDTLSAGAEITLIIEKTAEYIRAGKSFEEVCRLITEYQKHTKLFFILESLVNFANNGRVSPVVAKAVGILGIRIVGEASDKGELGILDKCRGEKKALASILSNMKKFGYRGGKVTLGHCANEGVSVKLKEMILNEFTNAQIEVHHLRGLCSFYAEKGGILVGCEC
ncbi:MAG: DegV family protein [Lachnospiraceae bacterium]|nr:DegV family protein [Lachnospiraceae bacterium]